ncbi:MAG TPA: EAL domain-containing protein [Hyphomicrobiaceae bacterium]|nr:EAL domain-containing protein [Hyphomicrobiaceae bacterium]
MRKPSVLVVDDDAFSRAVVSKKVAKFSDVVEAEDGLEALDRLKSMVFDLAVVDLEMPGFNGLDLIRCVRNHPKLKHIPILVLTANETRSALESALMAGATSFLLKPLNWKTFGEHINHVLHLAYRAGHLALHDTLTGLPNRVLLNERLSQALSRAEAGEAVATHMLDLDHFKHVNDAYGHGVGDKLLCVVAERLRGVVREADTVARMGGDEFAVVQSISSVADATALARRIVDAVGAPYDIEGHLAVIGASVGIALGPCDGATPDQLLINADLALYRAKAQGRGEVRIFETEMHTQMVARRNMEKDLRKALRAGEFELRYQPFVNLQTDQVIGFEALIRWHHPENGTIPPAAFIPLSEETGLIREIGEWALLQACITAARWPENVSIAVNISPRQFEDPAFVDVVQSALAASGLAANRLELEITESSLLSDSARTLDMLHRIQELGVRIANDDFGTGYSSLSNLRTFRFDRLKIDRSFVKDLESCSSSLNIVRAVAALASGLGIPATAEGVENTAQMASVRSEGCTDMQGYAISEPLPAETIEKLYFPHLAQAPSRHPSVAA